jgi:hypothetical protein
MFETTIIDIESGQNRAKRYESGADKRRDIVAHHNKKQKSAPARSTPSTRCAQLPIVTQIRTQYYYLIENLRRKTQESTITSSDKRRRVGVTQTAKKKKKDDKKQTIARPIKRVCDIMTRKCYR